jgi:very-short-patch-repair endonuclease
MDSSVLAVIELDDKSHESESRRRTDAKKDRATSAAGIRMIRWNVKAMPDQDFIREAFSGWPTIRADTELGAHSESRF